MSLAKYTVSSDANHDLSIWVGDIFTNDCQQVMARTPANAAFFDDLAEEIDAAHDRDDQGVTA